MKLALHRCWLTQSATVGKLLVDEVFEAFTLEDRYRPPPEPKVPRETCIPVGTYGVRLVLSPRFQVVMPRLQDVPGFEGVLIHPGNTPSDTEGCILVGREREHERVLGSRDAYRALFARLEAAQARGEPITIDVRLSPHEGISLP